ncbi:MAG: hypothetical protein AAFV32_04295 [Myxococcota bacterium]
MLAQTSKEQRAIDRAKTSLDRQLERLEDKYLDPKKARSLARKRASDLERERTSFERSLDRLKKAGAASSEVDGYKERFETLSKQIGEAISGAKVVDQRRNIKDDVPQVAAADGVAPINPVKPSWCEGVIEAKGERFWASYRPRGLKLFNTFSFDALADTVVFSCPDQDYPLRQQWVAAWRQHLSNYFGFDREQNVMLMRLGAKVVVDPKSAKAAGPALCSAFPALESGTIEVQTSRLLERVVLGCERRVFERDRWGWNVDVKNGFASELARASFIVQMLPSLATVNDPLAIAFAFTTPFAMVDVLKLDASSFESELSSKKLPELESGLARLAYYRARQVRREYRTRLKQGLSAAAHRIIFEAPKKAAAEWSSVHAKNRALVDMVLAVEDQLDGSPGGMRGCGKQLYEEFAPYLKKYMAGNKKASLSEILFTDYSGFQLAYGLTACGRNDPDVPVLDYVFGRFFYRATPRRGPLTAAYIGMLEAYNAAQKQETTQGFSGRRGMVKAERGIPMPKASPVQPPELGNSVHGFTGMFTADYNAQGVVKNVKKNGSTVTVSFVTKRFMVPIRKCVETNRIARITSDGSVIYKQQCTKVGEKPAQFTAEPVTMPAWVANEIKPGRVLVYAKYPNDVKPEAAWPLEVYDGAKMNKRLALLGVKL